MSEKKKELFDEYGLPRYLDKQAEMGYTKHIGGAQATRELLEICQVNPDKVLLNVGCGAGATTTYIVENYGCRVVGVDIKENMIESAREWAQRRGVADKTEFRKADAQDLPFEDNSFDILICESVNIFVPDREKAAREYKRVVKPGGVVGLNEPVLLKPPSPAVAKIISEVVGHEIMDPSVWEDLLRGIGLKDIIAKTYAVKMREESRNQFGFFSAGDYLRLVARYIKVLFRDSYSITLMRQATAANPKEYFEFMGYGLFVGRKE